MRIDYKSKTKDVLPLFNGERLEYALSNIPSIPFQKKPLIECTIEEFARLTDPSFIDELQRRNRRALVFLAKYKDYRHQVDTIGRVLDRFRLEQSAEERKASKDLPYPDLIPALLLAGAEFYHRESLKDSAKLKLSDVLLVIQKQYCDAEYGRRYQKIMSAKNANGRGVR